MFLLDISISTATIIGFMAIFESEFGQAKNLIERAARVLLVSHRRPDGDTLGATSGLYLALKSLGKEPVAACIDEISERLKFIPATEFYVREFDMHRFDLIIISDAGAYHMTGFHEKYPDFLSKKVPIINIDHHASNEGFGTVNLVDQSASSATVVVARLLKYMGIKFTREIGIALLAGIYNDTGGFMHSNTNTETFEIAAQLADNGVNVSEIVRPMFRSSSIPQLKLWGFILENLRKNEKGVVSSVVSETDFKVIGAHSQDTGGIVDLMNTVPDAAFTVLLAEDDGVVKGSLRTQRNDVDLSALASNFGGGGHKKASGFRVAGRLQKEIHWRISDPSGVISETQIL